MNTVPVTAIITGYKKIQQIISTLKKIQECKPAPAEILVHIDGGEYRTAESIKTEFPDIKIIESSENIGPGGGRNKLIAISEYEFVASFDDDSYPLDNDYFERLIYLFKRFPDASMLSAHVFHRGDNIVSGSRDGLWVADFLGGACAYRRSVFMKSTGYVPLPIAYGMEEVDVAMRLHAAGGHIFQTSWLRVFHDTCLDRHSDPVITAGSIANIVLLTYLRYPPVFWLLGITQCLRRILWLLLHKRWRGIGAGVLMIPTHLWSHRKYKKRIQYNQFKFYRLLRRVPVPENF